MTSQKVGSQNFWQIVNSGFIKDKSAMPPLFIKLKVFSSALDKAKLLAKNFSKNFNLDYSGIS